MTPSLLIMVGAITGAAVAAIAPRRNAALAELKAALEMQRLRIDDQDERIVALEAEVQECERGRAIDRAAFAKQVADLSGRIADS